MSKEKCYWNHFASKKLFGRTMGNSVPLKSQAFLCCFLVSGDGADLSYWIDESDIMIYSGETEPLPHKTIFPHACMQEI